MLKVILVDDEHLILKGLALTYNWESMGYKVVGLASSGEQALELIKEKTPDVILTDIQMNGMSGLELMEKGKALKGNLVFVMISAFKDFDYAYDACNKGAFSYIVKPVEEKKLEEVMRAIKKKITEEAENRQKYENWKKILLDGENGFQEMLLQKYLNNLLCLDEFSRIMELIGCKLSPTSCFSIVCADFDIGYKVTEQLQYEMSRIELFRELKKKLQEHYNLWGIYGQESLIFVLRLQQEQDIKIIAEIMRLFQKQIEHQIVSAVTPIYAGGGGLKQAYSQAQHFFSIANAAGAGFFEPDISKQGEEKKESYSEYAEQFVLNAIRSNEQEQIKEAYKRYIGLLPVGREESYQKSCLLHLLSSIDLTLGNTYGMTEEIRNGINLIHENIDRLSSTKMVDVICQLLLKINTFRLEHQPEEMNSYFTGYLEEAQAYIEENLSTPGLSIGDVAKEVYLNPVYFGRMFKSSCGISFKRYLLSRRMELAKKLLLEDLSISTIYEKVGIWNPPYFSQVFKQSVGCLPSQYKKQVKEREERESGV